MVVAPLLLISPERSPPSPVGARNSTPAVPVVVAVVDVVAVDGNGRTGDVLLPQEGASSLLDVRGVRWVRAVLLLLLLPAWRNARTCLERDVSCRRGMKLLLWRNAAAVVGAAGGGGVIMIPAG